MNESVPLHLLLPPLCCHSELFDQHKSSIMYFYLHARGKAEQAFLHLSNIEAIYNALHTYVVICPTDSLVA